MPFSTEADPPPDHDCWHVGTCGATYQPGPGYPTYQCYMDVGHMGQHKECQCPNAAWWGPNTIGRGVALKRRTGV